MRESSRTLSVIAGFKAAANCARTGASGACPPNGAGSGGVAGAVFRCVLTDCAAARKSVFTVSSAAVSLGNAMGAGTLDRVPLRITGRLGFLVQSMSGGAADRAPDRTVPVVETAPVVETGPTAVVAGGAGVVGAIRATRGASTAAVDTPVVETAVATFHPPAEIAETAVMLFNWKLVETASKATIPLGGCTGPATCIAAGVELASIFSRSTICGTPGFNCLPIGPPGRAILRMAGESDPDGSRLACTCALMVAVTPASVRRTRL